jgi:hypothetical protein
MTLLVVGRYEHGSEPSGLRKMLGLSSVAVQLEDSREELICMERPVYYFKFSVVRNNLTRPVNNRCTRLSIKSVSYHDIALMLHVWIIYGYHQVL